MWRMGLELQFNGRAVPGFDPHHQHQSKEWRNEVRIPHFNVCVFGVLFPGRMMSPLSSELSSHPEPIVRHWYKRSHDQSWMICFVLIIYIIIRCTQWVHVCKVLGCTVWWFFLLVDRQMWPFQSIPLVLHELFVYSLVLFNSLSTEVLELLWDLFRVSIWITEPSSHIVLTAPSGIGGHMPFSWWTLLISEVGPWVLLFNSSSVF